MRAEALLKRETNAQESGNNVAAIHRLLPPAVQLTAQFIRTIRNGTVLRMRWLAALAPLPNVMTAYLGPDTDTVAPPSTSYWQHGNLRASRRHLFQYLTTAFFHYFADSLIDAAAVNVEQRSVCFVEHAIPAR
jgi:hypothetical protein